MRSLRSRLILLWALCLLACAAAGALLVDISAQSTAAQVDRAEAVTARACGLISDRYAFYVTGWTSPVPPLTSRRLRRDLTAVVAIALLGQRGVEGGLWQADAGSLAYAYPTYAGGGPRVDLPEADVDAIRTINEQATRDDQAMSRQIAGSDQTLVLHACPLTGPIQDLTAWTMTQVTVAADTERLRLGIGVLLVLMLGMTGWLAWLLLSWSRRVARVETALAGHASGAPPMLAHTGEPSLDRIVDALNQSGTRLAEAWRQSDALAVRVARAEKTAALGRVAAGVAHEIRNPIAAMRLRAENALATDDPERRTRALYAVLDQVRRLDHLSGELLAMTQRREPRLETADLASVLAQCADDQRDQADASGISLVVEASGQAMLDIEWLRRVVDNLLGNAVRHTEPGGRVTLLGERRGDGVVISVEDTGHGVDPALGQTIFDPFVTGRPDGTGLGLAIARELVQAHGGQLRLDQAGGNGLGARFVIELPAGD